MISQLQQQRSNLLNSHTLPLTLLSTFQYGFEALWFTSFWQYPQGSSCPQGKGSPLRVHPSWHVEGRAQVSWVPHQAAVRPSPLHRTYMYSIISRGLWLTRAFTLGRRWLHSIREPCNLQIYRREISYPGDYPRSAQWPPNAGQVRRSSFRRDGTLWPANLFVLARDSHQT